MAAEAPARRAASPSASRATGRRWARIRPAPTSAPGAADAAGRPPAARSRRSPAADRPRGPVTKSRWPGRAPERSSGGGTPGVRRPSTAVDRTSTGERARSPPTTTQPVSPAASASPGPQASRSVPGGAATDTRAYPGRAPMAARSETATITALYPMSSGGQRPGSTWTPATTRSVASRTRPPDGQPDHGGVVPDPGVTHRRHATTRGAEPGRCLELVPQAGDGVELVHTGQVGPSPGPGAPPELGLCTPLAYH